MPIKKIDIPPGLDRQSSQSSAMVRWYDANNVRFNDRLPESVGGWVQAEQHTLKGIGRAIHSWKDFSENRYTCVATSMKYYILVSSDKYDITPNRSASVAIGSNVLSTINGSNLVTVTHTSHLARSGDFVVFNSVASAVGGFATSAFTGPTNEGFQIHTVTSDDKYVIVMPSNATSTVASGGGAVNVTYRIHSGNSSAQSGSGFGAGAYGGDGSFPTQFGPLPTNALSSFANSEFYSIDITGAGMTLGPGDSVYLTGMTGVVNGIDMNLLNDKWWLHVTGATTTLATIVTPYVAGPTPASGGGSNIRISQFDDTIRSVIGASRGWGTPSSLSSDISSSRGISIGNFGEDLIFAGEGGPIYYYDVSSKTSSGVPDPSLGAVELSTVAGSVEAPLFVDGFLLSDSHGHVVAWGTNDVFGTTKNSMLLRWCDRHNPFDWLPTDENESGGEILRHGSEIIGGVATREENLVFTNTAVYSMRYVGPPETYGVFLLTTGVGLYSRSAAVDVNNSVFFMGENQFYVYDGQVNVLEKSLSAYVFEDINKSARDTVFCGSNSLFSEVYWFYPGGDSIEPNKWVSFNYSNGTWSSGLFDMSELTQSGSSTTKNRTAWDDHGVLDVPMASYIKAYDPAAVPAKYESGVFLHESGRSADTVPMDTHIESGEFDMSDGDRIVYWERIIPDVTVFGANEGVVSPEVDVTISSRSLPGSPSVSRSNMTIVYDLNDGTYTPDLQGTSKRGRGRLVSLRVSGEVSGFGWRADSFRFNLRPDGRK